MTFTATPELVTIARSGTFSVASASTLTTSTVSCGTLMIALQQGALNTGSTNYEFPVKLSIETENISAQTVTVNIKSSKASIFALPKGKNKYDHSYL